MEVEYKKCQRFLLVEFWSLVVGGKGRVNLATIIHDAFLNGKAAPHRPPSTHRRRKVNYKERTFNHKAGMRRTFSQALRLARRLNTSKSWASISSRMPL